MKKRKFDPRLREVLQQKTTAQLDEQLQAELRREMPDEATVVTILDILRERDGRLLASDEAKTEESRKQKHIGCGGWVLKTSLSAAVLCIVLLAVPRAMGAENLCQLVARWTDTSFTFSSEETVPPAKTFETEHPGLQEIYDTVTNMGVTQPIVPMWVPDGYVLTEVKTTEQQTKIKVFALLKSGSKKISISYSIYEDALLPNTHAKDESQVTRLEVQGIMHYIISNDGALMAVWTADNAECTILADCTAEELEQILLSIY